MHVTNSEDAQIENLRRDIAHLESCRAALSDRTRLEMAFQLIGESTVGVVGAREQLSAIEAQLVKDRAQIDALALLKEYRVYEKAANNIEEAQATRSRLQEEIDADPDALAHYRYHVLGRRDPVVTGMGAEVDFWRNGLLSAPTTEVSPVRVQAMAALHVQHQAAFPSSDIMIVDMRGASHPEFHAIYAARKAAK